jgi:glycosyltransferase involved in cell wall biosynthesis
MASLSPADVDQIAKAMVRLALDRGEAVRLGRGARVTAAQLSWSAELDRLDALYRDILPDQADRAPGVTVAVA